MNEIFLIRHGEVIESYKRVFAGRTDVELSENGKNQAIATAKYLMSHSIKSVYASPMIRVRETVKPFVELSGIEPIFFYELVEIDFGEWTGLNFDQVNERFGINAYSWLEQIEANAIKGAESAEMLKRRVEPVLSRILIENTEGNVAIFSHGGIIRVIMSVLLDIPLVKLGKIGIDYCSVSKICVNGQGVSLRLLNYQPWKTTGDLF